VSSRIHVHADLAGRDQWAATARTAQLFDAEAEHRGGGLEDQPGCDPARLAGVDDVREHSLGQIEVHGLVVETGKGGHPDESTLELSDVVGDVGCYELEDLGGDGRLLALGLLSQDGQASLELRWLHIRDEAGEKAAPETVFQGGDRSGWPVRRDDDLLRCSVERV